MIGPEDLERINDDFESLSEMQQNMTLDMIEASIMHGDLDEDELMHYGVLGMKWGKHRARSMDKKVSRYQKNKSKLAEKSDRLLDKAGKFEAKALMTERKNAKKMYKLQRKELKYDMKGNTAKLKLVQRKIKKINIQSAKLKWKSLDLKYKVEKNQAMQLSLSEKIDKATMKKAEYVKKYLNNN